MNPEPIKQTGRAIFETYGDQILGATFTIMGDYQSRAEVMAQVYFKACTKDIQNEIISEALYDEPEAILNQAKATELITYYLMAALETDCLEEARRLYFQAEEEKAVEYKYSHHPSFEDQL